MDFNYYKDLYVNVVVGPHAMYYTEVLLTILLALSYIIVFKWMVSWLVSNIVGINKWVSDWVGYVVVIILTPTILYHYLHYEITTLTFFIFGAYSMVFILKQAVFYYSNNIS